jgi:hypothetical protein
MALTGVHLRVVVAAGVNVKPDMENGQIFTDAEV